MDISEKYLETFKDYVYDQRELDKKLNTEIIIEERISVIGSYSFYDLPNLKTLSLPNTIERIGAFGISKCPELEVIYHLTSTTTPANIHSTALKECPKVERIYGNEEYTGKFLDKEVIKATGKTNEVYWRINEDGSELLLY